MKYEIPYSPLPYRFFIRFFCEKRRCIARKKIKRVIAFMEKHDERLDSAHRLREIMKVESDIAKLYYPILSAAFKPELGFSF